ncbi:hypothetical protein SASPL_150605 [Salvia splendens]|uniref:Uncharacterized protein n=1 Tax=Salvia splendens TaxID=180675 RepID=A0A8X8W7R5_SALSN|nr:hypothetical protein SASPL_150605 [Salvia splendens]
MSEYPPSSFMERKMASIFLLFGATLLHISHHINMYFIHSVTIIPPYSYSRSATTSMASNNKRKVIYEGSPSGVAYARKADKVKGDRTRCSWTKREEKALLIALHDLVAGVWKSYNGFRSNYATRVYEVMKCEILDTQLKCEDKAQQVVAILGGLEVYIREGPRKFLTLIKIFLNPSALHTLSEVETHTIPKTFWETYIRKLPSTYDFTFEMGGYAWDVIIAFKHSLVWVTHGWVD